MQLSWLDLSIIIFYFIFVLSVGWYLKKFTKTGKDFFLAGRECTSWVAGLSFLAANMGALELLGWSASAYQYGIIATHWYWIGAIPAMLFLGIFMMPFYHVSKTHSVPGFLKMRYNEPTRLLSAVSFSVMTLLASGISMYSMGLVLATMLGWDFNTCIILSAGTVAVYVAFAGLKSAIFTEIIQFFLIWCGALLIPIIGLVEVGGWDNLVAMVSQRTAEMGKTGEFMHLWSSMGRYSDNPMGLHWLGIVLGLGWVVSFGYWTTDFLVVQRVLAAKDMRSAKMAPIIASFFKMAIPFIVILPGLIGIAVLPELKPADSGTFSLNSYNAVLPLLIKRYFAPGLLGLGVTALIAGFMSGMAGNISAFATVWTYDIYRSVIYKKGTDRSYLNMGRICIVVGIIISIGSAYLVMQFASIMDYMQALFSFFIAPLFGTIFLGMFWRKATDWGGFWGLLTGTCSSISMFLFLKFNLIEGKWVAFSNDASAMAQNMWRAWWAWCITILITVIVSKFGKPKSDEELVGLVYGFTEWEKASSYSLFHRPSFWACISLVAFLILNIIFF